MGDAKFILQHMWKSAHGINFAETHVALAEKHSLLQWAKFPHVLASEMGDKTVRGSEEFCCSLVKGLAEDMLWRNFAVTLSVHPISRAGRAGLYAENNFCHDSNVLLVRAWLRACEALRNIADEQPALLVWQQGKFTWLHTLWFSREVHGNDWEYLSTSPHAFF